MMQRNRNIVKRKMEKTKGELVSEIKMKWEGDLFELVCFSPYRIAEISPHKVQSVDLVAGRWGTTASVLSWTFTIGGEKSVAKEVVEGIDEKNKSISYKVIEGDVLNFYKTFKINIQVKSNEEDNLVKYTFEYEKKSSEIPDPTIFMDFFLDLSKDIERSCQLVPILHK